MKQNSFPDGWNEERVAKVLEFYDQQSDEEMVAEDEAAVETSETVMRVPQDLVAAVRELIAKHQS